MLVQVRQVSKWLIEQSVQSTSLPAQTAAVTLQAIPYYASASSVPRIIIIETLLNILLCLSSSLPLKLFLAKNK